MAADRLAPFPMLTIRIVWAAMLVAVGLFAVLVVVLPADAPSDPVLLPAFGMVALVDVALSFVLPRIQEKPLLAKVRLEVVEEEDPDAEALFRDQAPRRRVFADPVRARAVAMRMFGAMTILRCALSITPAIFGVVLHVTANAIETVIPFFVLSVVALAAHFPTDAKAIGPLERYFGAKLVPRGASARAA